VPGLAFTSSCLHAHRHHLSAGSSGSAAPATAAASSTQQEQQPAAQRQFGMLVRNYRSHPRLLELPSRLFYQDRLLVSWTSLLLLPWLLLLLPSC
jgi:hypothetical protein